MPMRSGSKMCGHADWLTRICLDDAGWCCFLLSFSVDSRLLPVIFHRCIRCSKGREAPPRSGGSILQLQEMREKRARSMPLVWLADWPGHAIFRSSATVVSRAITRLLFRLCPSSLHGWTAFQPPLKERPMVLAGCSTFTRDAATATASSMHAAPVAAPA